MKSLLITLITTCILAGLYAQPSAQHNLRFTQLPTVWDEAIPLGNGVIGALIWQKDGKLRFSLDRSDIWDLRPLKGLHREEFSYQWIEKKVLQKDYKPVQEYFDAPYEKEPAPSKIPAGGLEFTLPASEIQSVELSIKNAASTITWKNGGKLQTFIHANQPVGWFRFENIPQELAPTLTAPAYEGKPSGEEVNSVAGDDLMRLGYQQGPIEKKGNSVTYTQTGWNGFTYQINVRWKKVGASTIEGVWSISSQYPEKKTNPAAAQLTLLAMTRGYTGDYASHLVWWNSFWSKSSLHVPDSVIEKQWYLEQYKFGSTARRGAPPISLQAVWTADNGRLPPWKGDFHHDLNTQLSYWPAYSGNHMEEAMGYLDHFEQNKTNYKRYTKLFFDKEGLAIPGVTTLTGTEMGGWTQYSLSPTVSCWVAQHYYLQWRYSMDRSFLQQKAYPFIKDVCMFIEQISVSEANGLRRLPLSSSPEINDNKINAWFLQNTNYDLALMKFVFTAAIEMAEALSLKDEVAAWQKTLAEFGDYALSDNDELLFAPDLPYKESHRHFSHLMAIHPLSLIKWEDGPQAQSIIKNTINQLDKVGSDYWCGYSFSWLANLKARAKDGDGAARALGTFARAFCLPNSFHANGDQTKSGLSKFTYRPFTLEGNFAYAAGLQEMLLQSYAGFIDIMPAVPDNWKTVSFNQLRAEGAFLVSATRENSQIKHITIKADKTGNTSIKLTSEKYKIVQSKGCAVKWDDPSFASLQCKAGGTVTFEAR